MSAIDRFRGVRGLLATGGATLTLAFVVAVLAGAGLVAATIAAAAAMILVGGLQFTRSATPPLLPASARAPRRPQGASISRALGFVSINLGRRLLQRTVRPQYLFLSYAETDRDKRAYIPEWIERMLRPLFPSGLIRFGRFWGLMVTGKVTAETFEHSPEKLRGLLEGAREAYPNVEVIALAGRLPSIAARSGVTLDGPFIRGDRGTLCAMLGAAREQARLLGRPPGEVTIAIPGGAGMIGRQLVDELSREFRSVVAIDPRFADSHRWEGNVLFTDRHEDVGLAQAVLVLTARGQEAAGLVPFLAAGAVVADDTHPEIPPAIRQQMEARGTTVLKATVGDSRFRLLPRAPWFRGDDIPGCMLEALVVVQRGKDVLASQSAFNAAADELGFRSRLAPHMLSGRTH
ncbi:MAG: hypothetical protein NVSMB25_22730 [Thermoleophilaceae bacterium]